MEIAMATDERLDDGWDFCFVDDIAYAYQSGQPTASHGPYSNFDIVCAHANKLTAENAELRADVANYRRQLKTSGDLFIQAKVQAAQKLLGKSDD